MNKKVKDAYDEAGLDYFMTAYDNNESRFNKLAAKRKVTGKINQLYRVRTQEGKEYFYYQEALTGTDYKGNEIHFPAVVGKYDMPIFRNEYDPEHELIRAVEVTRHDTVYELPFSAAALDGVASKITEQTSFVIIGVGRRYSGFSFEDMRNRTFAELLAFGRTGQWPASPAQPMAPRSK